MAEKRVLLTVTCIETPSVLVSFEPEGAEHLLLAGDWFKVEIVGTKDGEPEISYLPDGLIIGAWSGARTRVWNKGGRGTGYLASGVIPEHWPKPRPFTLHT